uniref:Uncharacterized protein n=1 Tax=Odontella aurita TaxID=265563 RepID=A0A7S4J6Z4_9STRA|mmetsp:Transcript_40308/g.121413  ORF Transcript_40308/g.121413 Transcript_40308/m.121413 type:complete len:241 (+) Transcript_40308:201-923(+)
MLILGLGLGLTQPYAALRGLAAAAAISSAVLQGTGVTSPPPCGAATGYVPSDPSSGAPARLGRCDPGGNCVSSYFLEPPNRYVSPFRTLKTDGEEAVFRRAVRDVSAAASAAGGSTGSALGPIGVAEAVPRDRYLHLTVPGTSPGSVDDLELLFPSASIGSGDDGGIVQVRCEARVTLPVPPFCLRKNCINGNMDQRTRVEELGRNVLGLPPADRERMEKGSKWTPIFFNSDRVPGFDDN